MKNAIIILLCFIGFIFVLGSLIPDDNNKKPIEKKEIKKFEVYMNEPLKVAGLEITATDVKEVKKIHDYIAKNIYLKTYIKVKNTLNTENHIPYIYLVHKDDNEWTCWPDSRFHTEDRYNDFIMNGYVIKPNGELVGFVPFSCDSYLKNVKIKERNSKPSDFKISVYNQLKKDGGYIFLEQRNEKN